MDVEWQGSISIAAPPERVYRYLADFPRHGEWAQSVIELEQAGDSAKAAAEADAGLSEGARKAVLDAHLAICVTKAELPAS